MKLEKHPTLQRMRLKTGPSVSPGKESLSAFSGRKKTWFGH